MAHQTVTDEIYKSGHAMNNHKPLILHLGFVIIYCHMLITTRLDKQVLQEFIECIFMS
jgi:hypothetical protein